MQIPVVACSCPCWLMTDSQLTNFRVRVTLRPMVSELACHGVKSHLWPKTRFLLLSDSYKLIDVGCPLWWEGSSVVCQCSHSQVSVLQDSWPYITVSDLRLPQPDGPGLCIYICQELGGSGLPPAIGFPFCHLLWLVGLQWRYSNPCPCRVCDDRVTLWLAVYRQSARLGAKPLEDHS
jgi:hypothetical protein